MQWRWRRRVYMHVLPLFRSACFTLVALVVVALSSRLLRTSSSLCTRGKDKVLGKEKKSKSLYTNQIIVKWLHQNHASYIGWTHKIIEMVLASQVGCTRCVYSCISQGSLDHPCITRCHDILIIGILEKDETKTNMIWICALYLDWTHRSSRDGESEPSRMHKMYIRAYHKAH